MPFEIHTPPWTNLHDINLDWIIGKVKEYCAKVDAAITDFNDLKNYVDQYLDNNLVPAVNAKIDEMMNDGTLDTIISQALNDRLPVRGSVSNGTLQKIVDVAMSYIRKNNKLAYMHRPQAPLYQQGAVGDSFFGWTALEVGENVYNGPSGANGVQYTDENGNPKTGDAINCTTFAFLTMLGIPYEASRYTPGINNDTLNVGMAGYCFNPWKGNIEQSPIPDADGNYYGVGLYDNNQRMAAYFRSAGLLETLAEDASNAYPGDIIWKVRDGSLTEYHCGIVLHRYNAGVNAGSGQPVLLIAECVNSSMPCHLSYIHLNELSVNGEVDGWYYVGHPIYQTLDQHAHEVLIEQNTAFTSCRWDVSNLDIKACDYLTLVLTWKPSSSNDYLSAQVATSTDALGSVYHFPYGGTKYDDSMQMYEVVPGEPQNSYDVVIPFIPRTVNQVNGSHKQITKISINATGSSGTNTGIITNAKLIRGVPGNSVKNELIKPADIDELHSGILGALVMCDNHNAMNHIKMFVAPTAAITVDGISISENYATEADIWYVSSSAAVTSLRAVLHTTSGDAETTYASGTWS